jgi:iron complex outermembrane receptor protein
MKRLTFEGPVGRRRIAGVAALALGGLLAAPSAAQMSGNAMESISLDSLLNVRISAASRYAQTSVQAPASVTIVTSEDIERYGYRTVDDVLASVRGFYLSSDHNYSYIGVRGFSRPSDYNNRVLLMINGQRMNETFYQSFFGDANLGINLAAVERIEVIRGPASVLYGTSAMFGVVNVITKTGAALDGAQVSAFVGDPGVRHGRVAYGKRLGDVDVHVSGIAGRSDGVDLYFAEFDDGTTQDGIARGMDWESFGGVFARAATGGFSLQARTSSRRKGIPTGAFDSDFGDRRTRTLDAWHSLGLEYSQPFGDQFHVVARGHFGGYHYHGWYPDSIEYEDDNDGKWGGLEAEVVWDLTPAHRVTASADFESTFRAAYTEFASDEVYFDGDFPYQRWSVSVGDAIQVSRSLSFFAGIRRDMHSEESSATSPRLAAIYAFDGGSAMKLLYGEAFRAPSVYEREFESDDFLRNPELAPERIRTLELVWEQRLGEALQWSGSLYHNRTSNLIDTTEDETGEFAYFTNVGAAYTWGIEAEVDARLSTGVESHFIYALEKSQDRASKEPLTNSPRHIAKAGLSTAIPAFGRLATEVRFEDARRTLQNTMTPRALLVSLHVASRQVRGVRLIANVRNLLGADHSVPGGYEHLSAAIPQDPRSFQIGIAYRFQ